MNYSNLYDLITYLEYGTKLHISVLFFGNYGNKKLVLPKKATIHPSPVCEELKIQPQGFRRCFKCRTAAIKKAVHTKKSFSGLCINGICEYTRPIVIDDDVVCIILIGNILPKGAERERISRNLRQKEYLLETIEEDFDFDKCEAVGAVIESYIRMILDLYQEKDENKSFNPLIENLKKYIEANLEYKLDLSLLAKMFHYNEKYLGRLFKKETGMSFSEYINKRRVENSKSLLAKSDDTIIDISTKVGFNNVTYFNRIFKQHFNMTPTEYRQSLAKDGNSKSFV